MRRSLGYIYSLDQSVSLYNIGGSNPTTAAAAVITVRKRSLGKVMTPVCHFVHGGEGLCMMSLPVWLPGVFVQGESVWGESVQGALCPGWISVQGGRCQGPPLR